MAQVHPSRANLVPQTRVSPYRSYEGQRGRSRSRSPERRRSRSRERRASPSYGDYRRSDRNEGSRENMYASRERPPPPHMGRGGRGPEDLEECVFFGLFRLANAYYALQTSTV
jgi:hypothetical protein